MRDADLPNNGSLQPIRMVVDEEFIPFADNSVDLVVSNLSLHWVNDLPGTFDQVNFFLRLYSNITRSKTVLNRMVYSLGPCLEGIHFWNSGNRR